MFKSLPSFFVEITFDESGSLTPFRSVTTNYDAEARALSVGGATEPVSYSYTSFGAPKSLTDGNGNTTTYSYNSRGLLSQIVRPGGNTASGFDVVKFTGYAVDGQLLSQTDGRGLTTNLAYNDPDGAVSQISLPGETISLSRDAWGRVTGRSDASGLQSVSYSDADAPMSTTTTYKRADGTYLPGLILHNVYEADGTRSGLYGGAVGAVAYDMNAATRLTAPINLSYELDALGALAQLTDTAQGLISKWGYDANSRLTGATQGNGWTRGYSYTALDQVLSLTQAKTGQPSLNFGHATDASQQLRYDGAGNLTREVADFGASSAASGTTNYGYDGGDRLTGESSNRFGSYARSYALDAAFNRTSASGSNGTDPSWSRTLSGNALNQITASAFTQNGVTTNASYGYDGEGNRTSQTSGNTTTSYAFDSQQRLTMVSRSVNGAAASVVMKAGYRADGLRAWKENAQGVRTYFLYDGDQLVAEFDDSGVMQASQVWGAEGLAYRRTASGASAGNRFYSWDVRGNIAATTDSAGAVLNTPSSDGFSSQGGSEPCATFGGQVGGYADAETGLILFGQGYYDSSLGSWLTRDPIAEEGGINLYSYVQGNPVNSVDPDGLFRVPTNFSKKHPKSYKAIMSMRSHLTKAKYDAFKRFGQADKNKVDYTFTHGYGPMINPSKILKGWKANGAFYRSKNSKTLHIDEQIFRAFEQGKASQRLLFSTIEHETTHYFDDADGVDWGGIKGVKAEEGKRYERKVYGKDIDKTCPDWNGDRVK